MKAARRVSTGISRSTPKAPTWAAINYNTSKGAIVALTKTVAVEVGQFGITCNAICPGSSYGQLLDDALKGAYSTLGHDAIAAMFPLKRSKTRWDVG
ncbi:putative short-chain dehydrogenase reductase sdr protein [Neofusicoccum parvum UCRNP2]|uniref:Putative short-chain dehydrogenase reductase sdr protein n=1 Tax=Botryosphaeria parva (strain UCR-NP2) TaxID=1287680 RepID=R1EFS7_BOTPV|nr:putative short-chain dehydrogenase reductase sdr protein [Neofusicoccum parvum UCRNP2]